MKKRSLIVIVVMAVLLPLLFVLNMLVGSVDIAVGQVVDILLGRGAGSQIDSYIILDSRLPSALTSLLAGAALASSGLLLQSAFRNPLAGPGIFGISSGAGLMVAIVMLGACIWGISLPQVSVVVAAFVGALAVTGIILMVASVVRSSVLLLIVGIMIGYLSGSAITLLNFFASEQGVKSYTVWSMGTFGNVGMDEMPLFATLSIIGIGLAQLLAKPLNAMQLGPQYAFSLGVNIKASRNILLLTTGLLVAVVTAWCGPISFIGLAVPHVARLACSTGNQRILLPATALCGGCIGLLCNLLCNMPIIVGTLPLNAVTPFIGAPVIIYILIRH